MNYQDFIQSKIKKHCFSGFEIDEDILNSHLFDFQKFIVKKALKAGKYAVFADCGLGKTIIQLEWAYQVWKYTHQPVLILAPLAVSGQTIQEGKKFGIEVFKYTQTENPMTTGYGGIWISNYEQLDNINCEIFSGVVLDESSILKNFTGVIKNKIINNFLNTKYKLCCTATPSPNDLSEIGNHSDFLNIMEAPEMRARWFIRDESINNYRLKGHAEKDFYGWIGGWASVLRMPSDIGFDNDGFILPPLNFIERKIQTNKQDNGKLFNDISVNATNYHQELRNSMKERLDEVVKIIKEKKEDNFIIWIRQNIEGDYLKDLLSGESVKEVRGDEAAEKKESKLLGFANNEFRILITKPKIAQFGMNYQNCNNQIFASLDFSFESLYQSIRRSYRFKQDKEVNIYLITTDTMENVRESINKKQNNHNKMMEGIIMYANDKTYQLKSDYKRIELKTENYHIMQGDSCELMKDIPSDSIGFSVFSPPFSNLFIYSDNIRDLGNCSNHDEFYKNYEFILKELYRIIMPGRLVAIHTKDLAVYKNSSGYSGLYDFTGQCHRLTESVGFKYHSKITIWTDPVLEMQRTKTQRLLYKQVTSDSSYAGIGLPEYVTIYRKWEGDEDDWTPITNINKDNFPLDTWQQWASPVWHDIKRTDVLNDFRGVREERDEKHICPLQIGVIRRCIELWSNVGDTVFTPFAGIGSEVYQAVKQGRYGVGIELKESYFELMKKNLEGLLKEKLQDNLF